jgi:hypothetical protein
MDSSLNNSMEQTWLSFEEFVNHHVFPDNDNLENDHTMQTNFLIMSLESELRNVTPYYDCDEENRLYDEESVSSDYEDYWEDEDDIVDYLQAQEEEENVRNEQASPYPNASNVQNVPVVIALSHDTVVPFNQDLAAVVLGSSNADFENFVGFLNSNVSRGN